LIRRSLRIGLELLAALIAGLAILAGVLAWRVADGHPVHLGFLVPFFERSLAAPDNAFRVRLDDVVVIWTGRPQLVGFRAVGVRAVSKEGRELASVPQIGFTLSVRAMVHGLLAPTDIEIYDPKIHLRRTPDGRFQFLATIHGPAEGQPSPMLPEILASLLDAPNPNVPTGYLRRVHLIGGSVEFDDRKSGLTWHAPKIDMEWLRDRQGIRGHVSVEVQELGNPASFVADFIYDSAARDVTVHSRYSGVDIASLGLIVPELTTFSGSQLQFEGSFDTSVDLDGHFGPMRFTVNGGPGSLDVPDRFKKPLRVTSLSLSGKLDAGFDAAELDSFNLDLGGPRLSAKARVSGLLSSRVPKTGRLRFQGHVDADNVPVLDLPRLWPMSIGHAADAREWVVKNIDQGHVEHSEADFDLMFAGGDLDSPTVLAFGGKLKATGVGLHYLRPLPPIRGANGIASFDATKFVADFSSGGVGSLAIKRAHLTISGLDTADQIIDVEGDVHGPLREALQLLDNPRLGYARKVGINPAESDGTVSTHLAFRFPAKKYLPFEKVQLTAAAKIDNAKLGGAFFGHDVTDGAFELQLDRKGMLVAGKAKLADIPADLRWEAHFEGGDFRTRMKVASNTTTSDIARLGFDFSNLVDGPIRLDLVYTEFAHRLNEVAADVDLTAATATIDFAKWRKPPGTPGHASVKLSLDGRRPVAISSFRFDAGDFAGDGQGRFGPDGKLSQATFNRIALAKTKLANVVIGLGGERLYIHVGGGEFDAEPFLDLRKAVADTKVAAADPAVEKPTRAYTLTAPRLDRIMLGSGREIDSVRLALAYDGLHWQSIEADGVSPGGKAMTVRWLPGPSSTHRLSIAAADAGAALKVLGIIDSVVGGRLTISGTSNDTAPRRPITGHVEISEYRLVNQPALMRLFSIATLTGLVDALTGEGFQMYRFTGDFTKTGGRIDVPLARTYGPSLGLTASGYFDFDTDSIDVHGTIVPAYALNSLIGQIPIVGYLLTGGKGTGIFAVIYHAFGKLSEPTISVNPLSALAPGFLRGLFNLLPSGESGEVTALPPNFGKPGKND
jgi:hypothetical protein